MSPRSWVALWLVPVAARLSPLGMVSVAVAPWRTNAGSAVLRTWKLMSKNSFRKRASPGITRYAKGFCFAGPGRPLM